jgi:hypothetical protein
VLLGERQFSAISAAGGGSAQKKVQIMQMSLVWFGANAGGLAAHGKQEEAQLGHEEEIKPLKSIFQKMPG